MKDYLNGPGVCAWMEQQGMPMTDRNVQNWRKGKCVSVWQADFRLTKYGVHLNDLPDWLWIDKCDSCEIDTAEVEAAVLTSIRFGGSPRRVALRWNIPVELVEGWARQAGVPLPIDSVYTSNTVRRKRQQAVRDKAAA